MTITVEAQGKEFSFPDGTTQEQIGGAVDEFFASQAPAAQPQQEPSFLESAQEAITGAQRTAALPEDVRGLPEFGTGGALGISKQGVDTGDALRISAGLLTTFDEKAQADIIRSAIPDAKIEDFDGTTVIELPNGNRSVLNAPGMSRQDANTAIAQVLSFLPAGKIATLGTNLLSRVGIGAASSGATEAGLQAATQALGSEQDVDTTSIALATGLGGAAEVAAPAIQAVRQARINRKASQEAAKQDLSKEGVEAAEETGIDLFPAQITENASELEKQSFIGSLPAGAKTANKALARQNEQAEQAVLETLSSIAPPSAVVSGERKIRDVAQQALDAKRIIRKEKVSPIYKEAFETDSGIDVTNTVDLIDSKLVDLPASGKTAASLNKVKKLIGESQSLKGLHNAKLEIDDMLSAFGDESLGRTAKSNVKDIQQSLLSEMDASSPLYNQARQEFAALSPEVNALEDSIIGKIAGLDDTQLKSVSNKLFDAAETNPETVKQARKAITDIDPDAWNDIVRVELEKRMGKVRSDISQAGSSENVPGQLFNSIFGNTKQRRVLFNAVDPKSPEGKNLRFLEQALKRASKGRPGGSQTATREEIKRELRGGPVNWISNFFSPIQTVKGGAREIGFDKRVNVLSKALFDTEWRPQMNKIIKLSPNSSATQRAMLQLLNDVESGED